MIEPTPTFRTTRKEPVVMFFYWQKTTTGKWTPVKNVSPPGKKAEGAGPRHSNPVQLGASERGKSLDELALTYPSPICDESPKNGQ